jgi:hypothetical protein
MDVSGPAATTAEARHRLFARAACPHRTHLDRAEGMLDRPTARAHGVRIFVEPFLHGLDNLLVLPPRDATLTSRRPLSFVSVRSHTR